MEFAMRVVSRLCHGFTGSRWNRFSLPDGK
jgi:hypothetical protein